MSDNTERDPRILAIPDTHGHAKGEHKAYADERPLPLTARMLFLWFYHAARRGYPRFLMVADHMNYLTFEDPAAVNLVRRALKLAQAGDLYGAAETANVDVGHAATVSEGLRRGMRYSIGAEVDNDPRSRPDAQNIVDAMRPDGIIRSVHFIPITHPVHGENWLWPLDNPEFADLHESVGTEQLWETYVATLIDAIERLPGHIIGHFYVPAVFGHWPDPAKLEEYEDRVLAAAAARQMAIEFNTRFLYREHTDEEKHRFLEANKRLMRKARDRGVGIAIGSDAHSPKDQGNAFEMVLATLDELEINEIVFPIGGLLRRVALRVVREPEPEPVPEPPKPAVRAEEIAADPEPVPPKPARKSRAKAPPVEHAPPAPEAVPEPVADVAEPIPEPVAAAEPDLEAATPAGEGSGAAAPGDAPEMPKPAKPPRVRAPKRAAPPEPPAENAPAAPAVAEAEPVHVDGPAPEPVVAEPDAEPVAPAVEPLPAARKPKPVPAKATPAKPTAKAPAKPAPRKAAGKAAPVKSAAKKPTSAKAPAKKKAAPARAATQKTVTAKKAPSLKKAAPKKAAPSRAPAKKAAPAKKTAAKKSAPARSASAHKTTAAKKTTKKTATKRR